MSAQPRVEPDEAGVVELSSDEIQTLLDERARDLLGMTGEEFLRRWRAGEFKDRVEDDSVWQVVFLIGGDFAPR